MDWAYLDRQAASRTTASTTVAPSDAIMPRLAVGTGKGSDSHEREADRMAEEAVRTPARGTPEGRRRPPAAAARTPIIAGALGAGVPLDSAARAYFEPRLDAAFGDVRVHTGPRAARSADALGARAYTDGRDVVFGPRQYAPESERGRRLLAHELSHIAQGQQGRLPAGDRLHLQPKEDSGPMAASSSPCRPLTTDEIKLATTGFGDRVNYTGVKICNGPNKNPIAKAAFKNGNPAITLVKTIYVGAGYSDDYSKEGAEGKDLFMHEMGHIFQYSQLGTIPFLWRYGREYRKSGRDADKMYQYEPGKTPYASATLEAQAQMVGDYQRAVESGDSATVELLKKNLQGTGLYGL